MVKKMIEAQERQMSGSSQGGQQYYDADYKVVDDDDQNKK